MSDSVLFVDDDPAVLSAMRRLLLDEPYEVRTSGDPVAALDELRGRPPTVVVTDYYMPQMNGPAFLFEVRRIAPHVVRLVLTGKPDLGAVVAAVQEGAVHQFLIKPWNDEELKKAVHDAIQLSRLLAERESIMAAALRRQNGLA